MPGFMLRAEPDMGHTLWVPTIQWEGWVPIRWAHHQRK